jgi:hypothetical protein
VSELGTIPKFYPSVKAAFTSNRGTSREEGRAAMCSTITEAIEDRRLLAVRYDPGERVVEPHAYGQSSVGNELIRAYQTRGASNSGEPVGWKLLRVDKIERVRMLDEHFPGPRPEYRRNDSAMKGGVLAQL